MRGCQEGFCIKKDFGYVLDTYVVTVQKRAPREGLQTVWLCLKCFDMYFRKRSRDLLRSKRDLRTEQRPTKEQKRPKNSKAGRPCNTLTNIFPQPLHTQPSPQSWLKHFQNLKIHNHPHNGENYNVPSTYTPRTWGHEALRLGLCIPVVAVQHLCTSATCSSFLSSVLL